MTLVHGIQDVNKRSAIACVQGMLLNDIEHCKWEVSITMAPACSLRALKLQNLKGSESHATANAVTTHSRQASWHKQNTCADTHSASGHDNTRTITTYISVHICLFPLLISFAIVAAYTSTSSGFQPSTLVNNAAVFRTASCRSSAHHLPIT